MTLITRAFRIEKRYLLFPMAAPGATRVFKDTVVAVDGSPLFKHDFELAASEPAWWASLDVTEHAGKTVEVTTRVFPWEASALDRIHQSDEPAGGAACGVEPGRPQFHFSYRQGVLGDVTAQMYYAPTGEWHVFSICNPFRGRELCWGHAVSRDLLHWEERAPLFAHPFMIWNGVGCVDTRNHLGLNTPERQAMILFTPEVERKPGTICMRVSVDGGHTWPGIDALRANRPDLPSNPVIEGWGDAPRIYWNEAEQQYRLIHCRWQGAPRMLQYTSPDLKRWTPVEDFPLMVYPNIAGEGDAPEVLPMDLDGDPAKPVLLVMFGLNGYALAKPGRGGLFNLAGAPLSHRDLIITHHFGYPTLVANVPTGRHVILYNIGNQGQGGIPNFELGYRPCVSIPVELSLRTAAEGPRLFQNPVREIERLYDGMHRFDTVNVEGVHPLAGLRGRLFRVRLELDVGTAEVVGLRLFGVPVAYHARRGLLAIQQDPDVGRPSRHVRQVSAPGGRLRLDILVDTTSIEVFANEGEVYLPHGRLRLYEQPEGDIALFTVGGRAVARQVEVIHLRSIWERPAPA